jgi:pilus assembly protein FimV
VAYERTKTLINFHQLIIIFLLCGLPSLSVGLGLGDHALQSYFNEPLLIEIELLQMQGTELDSLEISLASPDDFEAFGIAYLPFMDDLQFRVSQDSSTDSAQIIVTGREPLREPYLDILIKVRWPGGSTLREYVMFVDPR